jgi:hypothetical protein
MKKWRYCTAKPMRIINRVKKIRMYKRHFVLMNGSAFLCCFMLAFGREYTSEFTEIPAAQPERLSLTYSTEDIVEVATATEPNAMTFSTSEVDQTETFPRMTNTPKAPNLPKSPENAGYDTGYPAVAGELYIRPYGPYLAGRRRCSAGDWGRFWPGLWGMNIFYSWSANSGRGEFAYWPYGYYYSWGDNPASDFCQDFPETESDPNAYGPDQPGDANGLLPEPLISGVKTESKDR